MALYIWLCKSNCSEQNKSQTAACPHWWLSDDTTTDNKNNHNLRYSHISMAYNMYCDTDEEIQETAILLISHSMWRVTDKKLAVRVTNMTESTYLTKKNTQIAEFSVVSPEQSKFFQPMDTAIFKMIPKGDLNLATYLNGLLRENEKGKRINTFWFTTPENLGKSDDHTAIQTQIRKELSELK